MWQLDSEATNISSGSARVASPPSSGIEEARSVCSESSTRWARRSSLSPVQTTRAWWWVGAGGSAAIAQPVRGSPSPSISRASAIVAARRPTSSAMPRALAIRSPFERAISPSGR